MNLQPHHYYNGTRWNFTWSAGKKLNSATAGSTEVEFTYDADGQRLTKKVNGVTHTYYYAGNKLLRETYGSNTLDFFYNADGSPYAFKYNGTPYYYITNLQGDVMSMVDGAGAVVASYNYDPYGNVITATGTMAEVNPLRYRGYYYDTETGFYYLQSRYYDPELGRFLNADAFASTGQGILGNNMFAYCNNNPVNYFDPDGQEPITAVSIVMVGVLVVAVMVASYCAARLICELGGWVVTTAQTEWRTRISYSENEEETLPRQGLVEGNPDAPPVDAGKQGKHVPGHNNHDKNRSSWPKGKNGVKQTQEAWENGVPDPKVPSGKVKIGIASDGTVVRVHINDKGAIHGYPLYPCP